MVEYRRERKVDAPVEAVMGLVGKPQSVTDWHQLIRSVHDVDADGFDCTMSMLATEIGFETEFGLNDGVVTMSHRSRKLDIEEEIVVTGAADDGSLITYTVTTSGRGLFRLFGRGLVPVVERAVDRGLDSIVAGVAQSASA